jgi:hypothetical protein
MITTSSGRQLPVHFEEASPFVSDRICIEALGPDNELLGTAVVDGVPTSAWLWVNVRHGLGDSGLAALLVEEAVRFAADEGVAVLHSWSPTRNSALFERLGLGRVSWPDGDGWCHEVNLSGPSKEPASA